MALQMVSELAGNDSKKWDEIESISTEALQKRILLWDAIEEILDRKNNS